jgi:cell division protein FtsB
LKKKPKKIGKLIFIVLILVTLLYLYFFGNHGYFALRRMENKADSLKALNDSLEVNLKELQARLDLLEKNDPQVIEEEARKLGLAGEDEGMIIVQVDSSELLNRKNE